MGILNPKKKKQKKEVKPPKWFMVAMVGFIAYAILSSLFTDNVAKVQKSRKIAEAKQDSFFVFSPLDPVKQGGRDLPMYVRDRGTGAGSEVGCWNTVSVLYKLYKRDGTLVEERQDPQNPLTFTVGQHEVVTALERGVLGMQPGGRREITARPEVAFNEEGFTRPDIGKYDFVAFDLRLVKLHPPANLPPSDLGLRIFSDNKGVGRIIQCTDKIRVRVKGWSIEGKALWEFSPYALEAREVIVGQGKAPYAIERALMGMSPSSKRMMIVPPGYGKPIFGENAPLAAPQETAKTENDQAPAAPSPEIPEAPAETPAQPEHTSDILVWEGLPIPQNQLILLEVEALAREKDPVEFNKESNFVQPAVIQ